MKKRILSFLLIFFCINSAISFASTKQAFCTAPALDVVLYSLADNNSTYQDVTTSYKNIPISWGPEQQDKEACPRIFQLLLHEIVTILKENDFEALIEIDNCYTIDCDYQKKSLTGWVLKEHLRELDSITARQYLPKPIEWQKPNIDAANARAVTIISSFSDIDGVIYSAGTRFLMKRMLNTSFEVFAYDELAQSFKLIPIPQTTCFYEAHHFTTQEKQHYLTGLLNMWTSLQSSCIPLVWGGASIGTVALSDEFELQIYVNDEGQERKVWNRPLKPVSGIYTGVDASSVILRAAHIIGIPYFCRNSITAAKILPTLSEYEYPQNGDLMWVNGGLLVINNVTHNMVVTTMSYSSGYGALVQLPLAKLFKDIPTYNHLMNAYRTGKPLALLNRDGTIARTVTDYKILKFSSVFPNRDTTKSV